MRISATDRIIREAQQHDSAAVEAGADEHPDTDKVSGPPLLSFGLPGRRPSPSFGDADSRFDDDDEDDPEAYEEGETQVDAMRSAAALDQMRALQDEGKLTPPPVRARRSGRHHGLPPGRPVGGAKLGLVPPVAVKGFPQTMLMFAAASRPSATPSEPAPLPAALLATPPPAAALPTPPPAAPLLIPAAAAPVAPPRNQPPRRTAEPFEAVRTPSPAPLLLHRRARVGRRTGFAIAATTAIAVTLILGSWTDRESLSRHAVVARPAEEGPPVVEPAAPAATVPPSADPSAALVAVAPPAAVAVPVSPSPAPVPPPPAAPPVITPPAQSHTLVSPPAPKAPVAAASTDEVSPLTKRASKRAQAAASSARVAKARLPKKKALASKKNVRAAKSSRAGGVGRTSAGPASRGHSDPDDTLPISD